MEKETRFASFRHSTAYDSRVEGACQAFFEAAAVRDECGNREILTSRKICRIIVV